MDPGPTHPTLLDTQALTQDQLDALERTYQSQLVSLILGQSNPARAKLTLDIVSAQLRAHNRDLASIIAGSTKIAQGIAGLKER